MQINAMTIRPCTKDDLADILRMSRALIQENNLLYPINHTSLDLSLYDIHVAVWDGTLIGYICGEFFTEEKNREMICAGEKGYYIEEMYIESAYRNRGIGKKMFESIEQYAKKEGCVIVELNAASPNLGALLHFCVQEVGMTCLNVHFIKSTK